MTTFHATRQGLRLIRTTDALRSAARQASHERDGTCKPLFSKPNKNELYVMLMEKDVLKSLALSYIVVPSNPPTLAVLRISRFSQTHLKPGGLRQVLWRIFCFRGSDFALLLRRFCV